MLRLVLRRNYCVLFACLNMTFCMVPNVYYDIAKRGGWTIQF